MSTHSCLWSTLDHLWMRQLTVNVAACVGPLVFGCHMRTLPDCDLPACTSESHQGCLCSTCVGPSRSNWNQMCCLANMSFSAMWAATWHWCVSHVHRAGHAQCSSHSPAAVLQVSAWQEERFKVAIFAPPFVSQTVVSCNKLQ